LWADAGAVRVRAGGHVVAGADGRAIGPIQPRVAGLGAVFSLWDTHTHTHTHTHTQNTLPYCLTLLQNTKIRHIGFHKLTLTLLQSQKQCVLVLSCLDVVLSDLRSSSW